MEEYLETFIKSLQEGYRECVRVEGQKGENIEVKENKTSLNEEEETES